jgi:dipeptidyl aminopeptidase/acylaminoacyl peptidase
MTATPLSVEALELALRIPAAPRLAPDGQRIAYTELRSDPAREDHVVEVVVLADDGGTWSEQARFAGALPCWSPDGSRLAFSAAAADGGGVSLWSPTGGGVERLVASERALSRLAWNAAGTALAFVRRRQVTREPHEPIVLREPGYRFDARPIPLDGDELCVVRLAAGEVEQLVAEPQLIRAMAWSPTEDVIAYCAGVHYHRPFPAYLVTLDGVSRRLTSAESECESLTWLPDGRSLLIGGKPVAQTVGIRHLLHVDADTGAMTRLAADLDLEVWLPMNGYPGTDPVLTPDGRSVLFTAFDSCEAPLYRASLDGSGPTERWLGEHFDCIGSISIAAGRMVTTRATPDTMGEVVLGTPDDTELRELTRCSGDLFRDCVKPEQRAFTTQDGTEVHGILWRRADLAGPQPLVLNIHGGPHGAFRGAMQPGCLFTLELAARGWNVLEMNPRGSTGRGDAFFCGVNEGWGTKDLDDFLTPLDALVEEGLVDPARMAVTGHSYGGFMTSVLVSQTDRFAVAVAGAGLTDFSSMYAVAAVGMGLLHNELGGPPIGRWELYDRLSPIRRVERIATPILFLHGQEDGIVPPYEAEAMFSLLRVLGRETELVLYPRCAHGWLDWPRWARWDYDRRTIEWFERHLPGGPPTAA